MSAQVNNTKSGWVHGLVTVSLILLGLTATGLAQPTTINVPGDQPTIQAAINAAAAGDTVFVSNGTYVLGATLNVTKGITIEGESEAGVVIDASSRGTGYGIYVEANNVTLKKFTLLPPVVPASLGTSSGGGFAIHCSFNHTVPYSSLTNLALANITIQNGNRAAFDIHGYDGVTLTDLTAKNSAYGNGIQITGCTDVTITGATVSGNAWGGIAFYVSKSTYLNRGCSGITYDMAANTAVDQPVYVEDEYGIDNSVTIANATYLIKNDYGSGTSTMWMYTDGTQADAIAIAQALNTKYSNALSQVTNSTGGRVVAPGLSITIQAAIDAASPGAMVEVAAGTYHEQLTISKALTLKGSDGAVLDGTGLAATWTTGIKIRSGNVTIDNIDVTKFTQDGITAYKRVDMPNIQIVNCRVSDIQPGYWGFGIYIGYESEAFDGYDPVNYPPGSTLTNHLNFSGLVIANNEISNTKCSGLVLQAITGTPGSLVVSNNYIHGISENDGIWIDCARNLTIVDNVVSNSLWGIDFTAIPEDWYTLDGPYGPKDIVLQGNQIIDNVEEGVALFNGWPETITLQENSITGNGTGVANFLSADLDVGRNYWGAADGPGGEGDGSGDTISTRVTYASYYVDAAMTTLVAPVVQVDDDFTPATPGWGEYAFATIQAGVNGTVSGGTVEIAAGTYTESNIALNKPITIVGESRDTVVLAPAAEDANQTNRWGGVFQHGFIVTTNEVSVRNLTIDGQANGALTPGKSNFRLGIATDDRLAALKVNNLAVSNVAVQNVFFYGISVRNGGTNLNISGNRIADVACGAYPSYGLLTFADGRITDNELVNPGYRAIGVANASVLVSNNTVSSAFPGDPSYGSEGIYVYCFDKPAASPVLTGNTIWLTNSDTTSSGMNLVGLTDDTVIGSNVIHLEANSAPDVGLLSWWNVGMPLIQSNVVTAAGADTGAQVFHHEAPDEAPIFRGNTFTATSSDGSNPSQGTGIFLTDDGDFFGDEDGITYAIIQGNTISGFARGVDLHQSADSPVSGRIVQAEISGDNTISASPSGIGIRVVEANPTGARAQATITDNVASIHGQEIGILVDGGSAAITNNAIYDNAIGVLVTNLGTVTAFSDNGFDGGAADDNGTDLQIAPDSAAVAIGGNNAFAGDSFYLINGLATDYDLSANGTTFESADGFAIEDAIFHKMDNPASGLVTWSPGEWFVTPASGSIQTAIGLASSGDTIHVGAGTYDEVGQIHIYKNLDIVGAGMGETIVRPTANTGSSGDARGWFLVDAGITFNLADVTLDGNGFNVYQGIRHKGGGTITGVAFTDMTFPGYGGVAVAAFGDDVDISGCTFDQIGRVGVLYYGAGITGSYFTGNTYTGKGDGDWLDYCLDISAGAVVFVDGNTITNCTGIASTDGSESAGILVTSYYGPGTTADIRNNIINGCTMGIAVGYNASDTSTVTLDRNNLADNDYGVYGTIAASASANYWGTADGPSGSGSGSGSAINDLISYNTWYADAAMTQLVYGNVLVDDDFTPSTPGWGLYAFTNIQQGVSAAGASGTVSVNPGTYEEQVEIAKDLLLQGTAPGVVIQSPVTLAMSFATPGNVNKPIVYVHGAMDVTIENVVVDGLRRGAGNYRFVGIAYVNAGGSVLSSEVKNITDNPAGGTQHGIGVTVYNMDSQPRNFALLDSYLHDCQKNCTRFGGVGLTIDIRRNRIFGAGHIAYTAQNGIQISDGATGTVADNIVSGFDYYPGPGNWAAAAILNYGPSVVFQDNIVTLSDYGIYLAGTAGGSVLTGNSFTGNDWTLVSDAPPPVLATSNWWGTPMGPITEGIYGDVDADPWLTAKPTHANALYLEASDESLFIKPGESIIVDMNVANLTTNVNACQAMLGYSSTYFDDPTGGAVQAGGGVWDQLIWDIWRDSTNGVSGEIDTAIGVDADGAVGTTADGTVAIITLTSRTNVEGITQMIFRPDADPDPGLTESTFLASIAGDPVWPAKVHSCNLVIDGTAPVMDYTNVTAVENQPIVGDVSVKDCSNTVYQGTVRISVIASDALAGLTNGVPTIQLVNGGVTNTPTFVGTTVADEFACDWVVDPATPNGLWTATVTATDYAGNETQQTFTLCVNRNQISGYVESEGFVGGDRVVTFVATGGTSTKTWTQTLTFTGDTAAYVLTNVPEGTTGLSAKTVWSLRSKLSVALDSGGQGSANFEDADKLRGGDIDNSNSVNVLDYSKLKVNWLSTNPVGDIDGNGSVGASDYSLMRLNWFQVGDPQ